MGNIAIAHLIGMVWEFKLDVIHKEEWENRT